MRLLEYEAKNILRGADLPVPFATIITSASQAVDIPTVLKSQVPIGGRGKAGGIRIIENSDNLASAITEILSLEIKGHTPSVLLAEEKLDIAHEYYLSLTIDRDNNESRLIAHDKGGIEVEENDVDGFLNMRIGETTLGDCAAELANLFNYSQGMLREFIEKLYTTFITSDATLIEINPLVVTKDNLLVCGDCKLELDDAAAFRHPEWNFEDSPSNSNFVTLNPSGSIATVANGAGLAMATVDAVSTTGMQPANFLDIGGGATTESILNAFRKIVEFPHVDVIVINIFAGITRCDEVAKAIIEAKKQIDTLPPLCIRLAGTNLTEAVALLENEGVPTLATLEECLDRARKIVNA